jgi:acyl-CoA thioester hydrolase
MENTCSLLEGFALITSVPVAWGDQDAFGHVNNLVYIGWCETARVEYLVRMEMFPELPPKGIAPILASIKCDYRTPLNFPDTVDVGTRVTRIGNSSFQMEHRIVSRTRNVVAAEADSTLVWLDYSANKPVRIPDDIRERIAQIEGRAV